VTANLGSVLFWVIAYPSSVLFWVIAYPSSVLFWVIAYLSSLSVSMTLDKGKKVESLQTPRRHRRGLEI
jgi:hypothetical protein